MGLLVDGKWQDRWYDTSSTGGRFVRTDAQFRNWVTADGSPGPSGEGGFKAEPGRYHLYVSLACPWAHRTLIFRKLKGLEEAISVSVVHWLMAEEGWTFAPGEDATGDTLHGSRCLHEIYTRAEPRYSGRVTVPVLWDKERQTIVSNESSEIIRMLNGAFDGCGAASGDYWPVELRTAIEAVNARVYPAVNNGVYRAGFATTQHAYDEAVRELFASLDWIEEILAQNAYLTGDTPTEADWRLFTTLVRFDAVYFGHFKCNIRRIADYPNISHYLAGLVATPGIRETIHIDHIKTHYYWSHVRINPTRIVPAGPTLSFL